jgi:putative DNA primase/helicase
MASLDEAINQMIAAGMPPLPPGHPVYSRIVRYGPKKRAWYILHEYRARNGKYYVGGAFGQWRGAENNYQKVETDWSDVDADERERLEATRRREQEAEREKAEKKARFAANRARQQYIAARIEGESDYLKRKKVEPERAIKFFADGTIAIPMVRYDQEPALMVGLQKIAPDGSKLFNKGMAKAGAACRLGRKPKDGDLLLVIEGVATALSVRMGDSKRHTAYIAYDAGNLAPVARILRAQFPKSHIVFCADDDWRLVQRLFAWLADFGVVYDSAAEPISVWEKTQLFAIGDKTASWRAWQVTDADGVESLHAELVNVDGKTYKQRFENAGRVKAFEAAREIGNARVIWPVFSNAKDRDPKWSDFNDLHCVEGLEAVALQIAEGISTPADAATPQDKAKKPRKKIDWDQLENMLDGYVLIRGTTTVWDVQCRQLMEIAALRLAESPDMTKIWLASTRRRMVNKDRLVFDPALPPGVGDGIVNMFNGFEIPKAPKGASCGKLLNLLYYLCNENDAVFDWVLKWTAYPLQHLGAKMQTAVVMYGKEGTGKNQFWGAVRRMYGAYGSIISQSELESQFNPWASKRMFIIANEVVSRQERNHRIGILKNLITEPEIQINDKNLPLREEQNHLQLVFFSNELQPLMIGPGDRRYLIVKTPMPQPEQYYLAVSEELESGGMEALYEYLMALDLSGFGPHTKPITTAAKEHLIELGLSSVQLFYRQWSAGELPLPYGPAISEDLYRAYRRWCAINGERMPQMSNRFKMGIMDDDTLHEGRPRVEDPSKPAAAPVQRTCLWPDPPAGVAVNKWLNEGVSLFWEKLEEWSGGQQ